MSSGVLGRVSRKRGCPSLLGFGHQGRRDLREHVLQVYARIDRMSSRFRDRTLRCWRLAHGSLFVLLLVAAVTGFSENASYAVTSASGTRPCGSIPIDYRPTPSEHYTKMYISAPRQLSCTKARQLMRRYRDGDGKGAISCGGSSVVCRYPDGWTCDSVTPGKWPEIQECLRRDVRIVGRVRSKIKGPR